MFYKPDFFEGDLDEMPIGLIVVHTPEKVKAQLDGLSKLKFTWTYKTSVTSKSDSVMIAFGAFSWKGNDWVLKNYTNAPFTAKDFSDWYSDVNICSDGKLAAGRTYTDNENWNGANLLKSEKTRWIFIARTSDGLYVKGEAIVESLREALPVSPTSKAVIKSVSEPSPVLVRSKTTVNPEIRSRAELFRSTMLEHTGVQLNYDEESVRWLDGYIVRNRHYTQSNSQLHETAGCFFGECIRETFGGEWMQHAETGHWMIKIEEYFSPFPFNKILKHFENEDGDSILGMFQCIGPLLAHERAKQSSNPQRSFAESSRPKRVYPKRPWWKLW